MLPRLRSATVLISLFVAVGGSWADTIRLRNGRVLYGRIVRHTYSHLIVRVRGRQIRIPKTNIRGFQYDRRGFGPARPARRQPLAPRLPPELSAQLESPARGTLPLDRAQSQPAGRWVRTGRSALLPGWGVWGLGRRGEAVATAGIFVGAGMLAYWKRRAALRARADYGRNVIASFLAVEAAARMGLLPAGLSTLPLNLALSNRLFGEYDARSREYDLSLAFLGAFYLGQLVRARYAEPKPTPRVTRMFFLRMRNAERGLSVGLTLGFD